MEDLLGRAWRGIVTGTTGPFRLRFVLQPLVATLIALRAGIRDAREGRAPFASALLTEKHRRGEHASRGWRDVGQVFVVAMAVDLVLQVVVRSEFVPLQAVLVAILLALVPYLVLCGLANRLARRLRRVRAPR